MAVTRSDPRLRLVAWKDLVQLSRWEQVWELTLSVPWLVGSLVAYGCGMVWLGAIASFFFFLTGLRQSHNAQHSCLGIGRRAHDVMLFVLSVLMLASMHAVKVTHLHHHRHCLDDEDIEAAHTKLSWWRVLVTGPLILVRLHESAWKMASRRDRRWIALELVTIALIAIVAMQRWMIDAIRWHVLAMFAGELLTGFFAVWTVHHGCDAEGQIARTQRGWMKTIISYSMFFHLEHHLFPAVPTCKLDVLATRLDRVCPEASAMRVF